MRRGWARPFVAVWLLSTAAQGAPDAPDPAPVPEAPPPPTGDPSRLPPLPPTYPMQRLPGAAPTRLDAMTPPPVQRGAYVHDGLFLRLSVGPGVFHTSTGVAPDNRSYDGGVVTLDAAIGGAAARGWIIGGAYQMSRVFSLSVTDDVVDGDEPDASRLDFTVHSLSVFVDFYPDPMDGLHFLAALGEGWLDVSRRSSSDDGRSPSGLMVGAAAGYEWFVGPSFSLGLLARANIGFFSVDENLSNSTAVTTFVPSLLATATYN
jgi:hypothetical protein